MIIVRNVAADTSRGSGPTWRLRETLRIGRQEGDGPEVFGYLVALEVDASERIYALDMHARQVKVFDNTGAPVRTIGRPGNGPGEFSRPFGLAWDTRGRLWIPDAANARYTAFDTAGQPLAQLRRRAASFAVPFPGGVDADGRVVDVGVAFAPGAAVGTEVLLRFTSDTVPPDTFPLPRFDPEVFAIPQQATVLVPFSPVLRWRLGPASSIWFGTTDAYRLYQRSLDGDTLRIVERPWEAAAVTSSQVDSALAALNWFVESGGVVDRARLPRVHPAFTEFFVDDLGRLWVRPGDQPATGTIFDVFDSNGIHLGTAHSEPAIPPFTPFVVRRGRAYAVVQDVLDVQYVIRLEIAPVGGS